MDLPHNNRKRPCPEDWQQDQEQKHVWAQRLESFDPASSIQDFGTIHTQVFPGPSPAYVNNVQIPSISTFLPWDWEQRTSCEVSTTPGHDIQSRSLSHVLSDQSPDVHDLEIDLNTFKEMPGGWKTSLPSFPNDALDVSFQSRNDPSTNPYAWTQLSQPADTTMVDAPNNPCSWEYAPEFNSTPLHEHGLAISDQESSYLSRDDLEPNDDSEILSAAEIAGARCRSFKAAKDSQTDGKRTREFFSLRYRATGITLLRSSVEEIGVMDLKHGTILKSLRDVASSLRCEAYIVKDEEGNIKQAKGLAIEIHVYASSDDIELVGSNLSNGGIFLQEPDPSDISVEYRNPHIFSSDFKSQTPYFRMHNADDWKDLQERVEATIHAPIASTLDANFKTDSRIKRELRSHQIQAVDFMLLREEETVTDERFTLWNLRPSDDGKGYSHKLTGSRSQERQTECRGGLLADDMGMGKTLSALTLIVHTEEESRNFARIKCNDTSEKSKLRSRATLIITPKTTIHNWENEVLGQLEPGTIKHHVYQGTSKAPIESLLQEFEMIITTYDAIAMDSTSEKALLKHIWWFRIILDEAHEIRNSSTLTFKAIEALDAERRWCLTGTPVHNKLGDLFSLARFLRYYPFADPSVARKLITHPLQNNDRKGLDNLESMRKLFSLQRVRDFSDLPKLQEQVISVELSDSERQEYQSMEKSALSELVALARSNITKTQHIKFRLEIRLRQICCHGVLREHDLGQSPMEPSLSSGYDSPYVAVGAEVHSQRHPHTLVSRPHEGQAKELSSKLAAVVSNLTHLQDVGSSHPDCAEKSLVFSLWTTTFDILQPALLERGMKCVRIEGSMSLDQRRRAIDQFKTDPDIRIMLLTLGTGAVGLNLTVASQVHIVEPHWNPMMEKQAAARVHRLGQTREVTVNRYIVKNSVEERIRAKQTVKRGIAELIDMHDKKASQRILPEDW